MRINGRGGGLFILLWASFFLAPSFAPLPSAYGEAWEPSDYGRFVAGGLTGFVIHEGAHLLAAESFGLHPHVGGRSKPVPFVVIRYDLFPVKGPSGTITYVDKEGRPIPSGAEKKFATASAGINSQNLTSELILSSYPHLREERRPFLKGILAFDIVTSIGYALVGRRDPDGDLRGMAESRGANDLFIAVAVFAPAAIDLYRYYYPESAWAPWAARGAKGYLLGLSFRW